VPSKRVSRELAELHRAMVDIAIMMYRPQQDDVLLREAGVSLDRTLFPLLVAIDRFGPIGIVELADQVGRDYTTISRKAAKLADLGLITRRSGPLDRRMTEASVSDEGRKIIHAFRLARERLAEGILARWDKDEFSMLVRLLRRFVDDLKSVADRAETRPTTVVSKPSRV